MIQAFEQHMARWLAQRFAARAAESPLFGPLHAVVGRTDATGLDLPDGAALLFVRVVGLDVPPEAEQVGMASADPDGGLPLRAHVRVRLAGPSGAEAVLAAGADVRVDPAAARLDRADLCLLTVLHALREPLRPRPDGPTGDHPDAFRGWARLAGGMHAAEIRWNRYRVATVLLEDTAADLPGRRTWAFDMQVELAFRLSPAALDGGRILEVAAELDAPRASRLSLYAPGEALPLADFQGLGTALCTELAFAGLATPGDLATLSEADLDTLLARSRTGDEAQRTVVREVRRLVVARGALAPVLGEAPVEPELLAAPAAALLDVAHPARTVVGPLLERGILNARVTMLATPMAVLLRPERRETVKVGQLLSVAPARENTP